MMNKFICIVCFAALPLFATAQDLGPGPLPDNAADFDREPAALPPTTKKRNFPGAADEEDLRVLASLPEAAMRIDARSLQREVYKQLYNQELKEETQNDLEE
jgi:hypothetical protein